MVTAIEHFPYDAVFSEVGWSSVCSSLVLTSVMNCGYVLHLNCNKFGFDVFRFCMVFLKIKLMLNAQLLSNAQNCNYVSL